MNTIPQNPQDHITRAVGHVLAIIDLLKAFDTGDPDTIEHARQVHDVAPEVVAGVIRSELRYRVAGSATLVDLLARYEPDIITPTAPVEPPPHPTDEQGWFKVFAFDRNNPGYWRSDQAIADHYGFGRSTISNKRSELDCQKRPRQSSKNK